MKDNKKITTLILVLVLTIFLVASGTFAYWRWATSTAQQTLVNVMVSDDATIFIADPEEELGELYPISDCNSDAIASWASEITVTNGTGVKLATNFKLKVKIEDKNGNIITTDTNQWNSHDYKYYIKFAVTEANETCNNALYKGRFDGNTPTDEENLPGWYDSNSITLRGSDGFPNVSSRIGSGVAFHAAPNTVTKHTYKVWVWIDENYKSVTSGTNSTLDPLQDAKIVVSWSENSELEQVKQTQTKNTRLRSQKTRGRIFYEYLIINYTI
jgi:hypothetical protein